MSSVLLTPDSAQSTRFAPHHFNGYATTSSTYEPYGTVRAQIEGQSLPPSFNRPIRHEFAEETPSITIDDASEPGWGTVNRASEAYGRDGSGTSYAGPTALYATQALFTAPDDYFSFQNNFTNGSGRY